LGACVGVDDRIVRGIGIDDKHSDQGPVSPQRFHY
jgi:hypothetical protein